MVIFLLKFYFWGYGVGMGGIELGYVSFSGVLIIDSYYLMMLFDVGVFGFVIFMVMFMFGIWIGV